MIPSFEGREGVAYCESKGYHFTAARLAEGLGMDQTAVTNYMKAQKMLPAARVLARIGDRKGACLIYLAAVKEHLDKGDYAAAARIEREMGNEDSAKQLYATAIELSAMGNDHWQTAMIAEEAGAKLEARVYKALAREADDEAPAVM